MWDPDEPLHRVAAPPNLWRLPKCIRHDQGIESTLGLTKESTKASVLLIEDLGKLVDIFSCFEQWANVPDKPNLEPQINDAGVALGASLAELHSQHTIDQLSRFPKTVEILSQSLTNELVWAVMVDPLSKYLKSLPDGEELCRRVTEDIKTPNNNFPQVLCHGDFHNGNIMLPTGLPGQTDSIVPIVVDWEFAHLNGRGINGDAAELTAGLHCKLITARNDNPPLAALIRGFLKGFCSGYRETAARRYRVRHNDVNLQLLRSALLFHGTEMISCAYEYASDSKAFEEIFGIGVWYLRRAGSNVEEFMSEDNMLQLEQEDESIVTSLFLAE